MTVRRGWTRRPRGGDGIVLGDGGYLPREDGRGGAEAAADRDDGGEDGRGGRGGAEAAAVRDGGGVLIGGEGGVHADGVGREASRFFLLYKEEEE